MRATTNQIYKNSTLSLGAVFGGEVAGMACGPTPKGDWDTMYGCEVSEANPDGPKHDR